MGKRGDEMIGSMLHTRILQLLWRLIHAVSTKFFMEAEESASQEVVRLVECDECKQVVNPGLTFWDGTRLTFKCPKCDSTNSQAGRFSDWLAEVQ